MKQAACPRCGRAMKTGVLTRMNEVWWHPDGEKKPELKDFLSWKGIKQLCSDHMAGCIEILDAEEGWIPILDDAPAYHCPDCKIFIFEGREGQP